MYGGLHTTTSTAPSRSGNASAMSPVPQVHAGALEVAGRPLVGGLAELHRVHRVRTGPRWPPPARSHPTRCTGRRPRAPGRRPPAARPARPPNPPAARSPDGARTPRGRPRARGSGRRRFRSGAAAALAPRAGRPVRRTRRPAPGVTASTSGSRDRVVPEHVGEQLGRVVVRAGHPRPREHVGRRRARASWSPGPGHCCGSMASSRAARSASTHEAMTAPRSPSSTWSRL